MFHWCADETAALLIALGCGGPAVAWVMLKYHSIKKRIQAWRKS